MKVFWKMMGLIGTGLLVAVVIYPFLHEIGHSLVALLVGARIVDFNVLPVPFVVCEVSAVSVIGQMLIGLGGIVFPFALSMILRLSYFWIWYISFLLKGISVFSIILSIVSIVFYMNGYSWENEDIIQVLNFFPDGMWFFMIVLCIMGFYGIMHLSKEKLIEKCIDYFIPSKNQQYKKEQGL